MKSAVFMGRHDVRIMDLPIPEIKAGEVLIEVMACGICGTDVHIYEGDKGAADCVPPTVLGHEFAGRVAAVGDGVISVKVGDRVCVDPNDTCGACFYCREGMPHFCEHMIGYGTITDGAFAQYCKVREKVVYPIDDHVSYVEAAMAEPVSCCLHGIDLCHIRPGTDVVIIGGGMIGLLMMQLAKCVGAARVAVLEPVPVKREMASRLGADIVLNPQAGDVQASLKASGLIRAQTVIECVGLPSTMEQAVQLAANKGMVMFFGLTKPDDEIPLKPFTVFQKELTITASYINPCTIGRAVQLINQGRIDVKSMICEEIPLERLKDVLSSPELRRRGKYVVNPQL